MRPGVTVVVPFHEARRRSGLLDRAIRTVHRQTVPVHIRNIYRKLEASNRSEAVFEASRLGLIRL